MLTKGEFERSLFYLPSFILWRGFATAEARGCIEDYGGQEGVVVETEGRANESLTLRIEADLPSISLPFLPLFPSRPSDHRYPPYPHRRVLPASIVQGRRVPHRDVHSRRPQRPRDPHASCFDLVELQGQPSFPPPPPFPSLTPGSLPPAQADPLSTLPGLSDRLPILFRPRSHRRLVRPPTRYSHVHQRRSSRHPNGQEGWRNHRRYRARGRSRFDSEHLGWSGRAYEDGEGKDRVGAVPVELA